MTVRIQSLSTERLNIKLRKPIRMSFGEIRTQHILLIRLHDQDGLEGVGESCVMGGPYWGSETIEGVEALIAGYVAPFIASESTDSLAAFSALLGRLFKGNGTARAGLEMAYLDLAGKRAGVPASVLLGGAHRDRLAVAWTVPSHSIALAIEDAEEAFHTRGHRMFKLKVGIADPDIEIRYAAELLRHLDSGVQLLIDVNQGWDEMTARRVLPRFSEVGVSVVEQPIPAHDLMGLKRLTQCCGMPVIADESITGPGMVSLFAECGAVSGVALKPQRDGGLLATQQAAQIAADAGLSCYGGTMLETSLGTAALCALYACAPTLAWGCELFGPLRLEEDIVLGPLYPQHGLLQLPTGAGIGVTLDEERISYLVARSGFGRRVHR